MYIKSKSHLNIKFHTYYNVPAAKTAQGEGLASIPDGWTCVTFGRMGSAVCVKKQISLYLSSHVQQYHRSQKLYPLGYEIVSLGNWKDQLSIGIMSTDMQSSHCPINH
jgi:hypothetical protein